MHPKVTNVPKQISLLRSWFSFFCVEIYKDLAPPEPFFNPAAAASRLNLLLLVPNPATSVAPSIHRKKSTHLYLSLVSIRGYGLS
jgi:hypothetical protein